MIRPLRILGLLIAVAISASGIRAQEYSAVVVFGDSLSDAGNVAQALPLGLPPGNSFTTNPDPVWAEIVAQTFGAPGSHSGAGGSNHAVGGACVDPGTACNYGVPRIDEQIDRYLSGRPSGVVDPRALHAVWGGVNDIETIANPGPGIQPVIPGTAVPAAARALVDHVRRLREAGARHIVVFNLPDPGATPFARLAALKRSSGSGRTYRSCESLQRRTRRGASLPRHRHRPDQRLRPSRPKRSKTLRPTASRMFRARPVPLSDRI